MITCTEFNERNREFWANQLVLFKKRVTEPALVETALDAINSETARGLPIGLWNSFENALAEAERARPRFKSQFAREAAATKRGDVLQEFIENALHEDRELALPGLLRKLRTAAGTGSIFSITEKVIEFEAPHGTVREAPISGLKDRLSRAKKKLSSR